MPAQRCNPAVFLFVLKGCGACEEFLPRFRRVSQPYEQHLPIGVYDMAQSQRAEQFGTKLGVNATPTMVLLDRYGRIRRSVGAVDDASIVRALSGLLR